MTTSFRRATKPTPRPLPLDESEAVEASDPNEGVYEEQEEELEIVEEVEEVEEVEDVEDVEREDTLYIEDARDEAIQALAERVTQLEKALEKLKRRTTSSILPLYLIHISFLWFCA